MKGYKKVFKEYIEIREFLLQSLLEQSKRTKEIQLNEIIGIKQSQTRYLCPLNW